MKCGETCKQPFTLVAVEKDDQPLIYVNQFFREMVQYQDHEVLGKNCRFLQGPLTDRAAVRRIREAIQARNPHCEDIVNYRKDGSMFWNRLVLLPIRIKKEVFYFGMQHDVTDKRKASGFRPLSADPHNVADWIRNRLSPVILYIDMMEENTELNLPVKVSESLDKISNYVLALS